MAYIAQRAGRISGTDYAPGDAVPAEAVGSDEYTLVRLGYIAVVPDSAAGGGNAALVAELEKTKAALAAAEARLTAAGIDLPPAPSFDPGEHTVAEVTAHVDAQPDDVTRVRAVEVAGQARKTLLADLDRRLAAAEAKSGDDADESGDTESVVEDADEPPAGGVDEDDQATGAEDDAAGAGDDPGGTTEVR